MSIWSIAKAKKRWDLFGRSLAFAVSVGFGLSTLLYIVAFSMYGWTWHEAGFACGLSYFSYSLMRYAIYRKWP